ncbi:gas2 domain-containing protein [Ophiostoma piceae UAMH 11346]|uniref:Gas2 domain-containing protein n=1 Tax=Ophiostoma piceae (strain UAMH 11346) TaxID=1262450 RepID=S3C9R5_OPHP1|nr:gas2 domain-containing protein [Ophiostoma piceae UAMH 11346]
MSLSGFPILAARTSRLAVPSRQYYRNSSGSPTRQRQQHFQQHVDDLITQLTPTNAVSALRHPTGPLKACLDVATASEQSFAMRAALASSSIQEWLDELSDWDWPEAGGSCGFEEPDTKRQSMGSTAHYTSSTTPTSSPPQARTLSPSTPKTPDQQILRAVKPGGSNGSESESGWMGSLLASDVLDYERRIAEITHEIEELEVEDMKQHVLHHHILPLSPPGTPPIGGGGRLRASASSASLSTLTKMDDLTAVVTAIVLQALPLLSKLTRLLDVWRIRLIVLKKIPTLLSALSAADLAIQSAWNAIRVENKNGDARPTLRREEFGVMKSVVEDKVSRAAQITDFMLDSLDGWEDTIPEKWIDRIDAAERGYGEWVAACERKIREGDWKRIASDRPILTPPVQLRSIAIPGPDVQIEAGPDTPMTTIHNEDEEDEGADLETAGDESMVDQSTASLILPETPRRHPLSGQSSLESLRSEPELPSFKLAKPSNNMEGDEPVSPPASIIHNPSDSLLPSDMDIGSDAPIPRGLSKKFRDDVSNLGDISYLSAGDDLEPLPAANRSPSSSPPDFRASVRSTVTFNDMPTVAELPGEESPTEPKTPLESSFMFDDLTNDEIAMSQDLSIPDIPQEMNQDAPQDSPFSTRRLSVTSEDDQLQQQISEILESIPAKIHLSSQPSPSFSHLNPPDFKMPVQPRKPRTHSSQSFHGPDGTTTRSLSSMSTRSMTPSFLLAPAYARKPRQQRGNQDIKLYHLSRSTGEAPIKLFIRLVGGSGERVMVRVGGGWADLSEYLKEYASHHSRRSKSGGESAKIEIRDLPVTLPTSSSVATSLHNRVGSSPPSRPGSAMDRRRPESPLGMPSLNVRKVRRATGGSLGSSLGGSLGGDSNDTSALSISNGNSSSKRPPQTPLASVTNNTDSNSPSSGGSGRSRSSSAVSWTEEDSSLGMSGPRAKNIEMSDESKAWVESVKERVRIASGERRTVSGDMEGKFGDIGKVGGTKRVFRRGLPGKVVEK